MDAPIALLGAACFLGFVVGLLLGSLVGHVQGRAMLREDAIRAGVAHWSIDPKTGETSFRRGKE